MRVFSLNFALMKEIFTCISARYSVSLSTSMDFMPGTQPPMTCGSSSMAHTRSAGAATFRVFSMSTHFLRGDEHRFHDLGVARAAAQVAVEAFADLFCARVRVARQ